MMWMMCEGWPQHRGLRLLLFSKSGVGSFMSPKNQTPSLIFGCPKEEWGGETVAIYFQGMCHSTLIQ